MDECFSVLTLPWYNFILAVPVTAGVTDAIHCNPSIYKQQMFKFSLTYLYEMNKLILFSPSNFGANFRLYELLALTRHCSWCHTAAVISDKLL